MDSEERAVLAAMRLPVFAVDGMTPRVIGWSGTLDRDHLFEDEALGIVGVTLDHEGPSGAVQVESDEVDEHWIGDQSDLRRSVRDRVEDATTEMGWLTVDGVPLPFAVATSADGAWAAAGRVGDVMVRLDGRGLPFAAVGLRRLAEPTDVVDRPADVRYADRQAARGLLDPARVEDLLAGSPVADLAAQVASLAQPALSLLPSREPTGTRLHGLPELPPGTAWPSGRHGPMLYVGRIALDELDRAVWPGPAEGALELFCAPEPDAFYVDEPGNALVVHVPPGEATAPLAPPPDLPEDLRTTDARYQRLVPGLTIPEPDARALGEPDVGFGRDRARTDAYYLLLERLEREQGWEQRADRILGWPLSEQDDVLDEIAYMTDTDWSDWTVLLQTDAFDVLMVFALPAGDAARGDFSRAQVAIQHD